MGWYDWHYFHPDYAAAKQCGYGDFDAMLVSMKRCLAEPIVMLFHLATTATRFMMMTAMSDVSLYY